MWGGIDPGDHRLGSRAVGVVHVWKYFSSGDENLSSLGVAVWRDLDIVSRGKSRRAPRAGSMGPSQSEITQWGWGFHTLFGGIDPEDHRSRPGNVRVVEIWKDF